MKQIAARPFSTPNKVESILFKPNISYESEHFPQCPHIDVRFFGQVALPPMELNKIKNLALSETGFLFDPATGNTFTLNESAIFILKSLKTGMPQQQIADSLAAEFEVSGSQALEDVSDALLQLREAGLIAAGSRW